MSDVEVIWDERAIPRYMERFWDEVRNSITVGVEDVAAVARATVKVDTGSLKDTITAEALDVSGDQMEWVVYAGDERGGGEGGGRFDKLPGQAVDYAINQEYNLDGNGKPFMTPASEKALALITARLEGVENRA